MHDTLSSPTIPPSACCQPMKTTKGRPTKVPILGYFFFQITWAYWKVIWLMSPSSILGNECNQEIFRITCYMLCAFMRVCPSKFWFLLLRLRAYSILAYPPIPDTRLPRSRWREDSRVWCRLWSRGATMIVSSLWRYVRCLGSVKHHCIYIAIIRLLTPTVHAAHFVHIGFHNIAKLNHL